MARSPITLPGRLSEHEPIVNELYVTIDEKHTSTDALRLILMRRLFGRVDHALAVELAGEAIPFRAQIARARR
jgi:hypothetical protein